MVQVSRGTRLAENSVPLLLRAPRNRVYLPVRKRHLRFLVQVTKIELEAFFRRNPRQVSRYRNRFLAAALCQGAALHYLNRKNGVKDFDIHLFYVQHPKHKQMSRAVKPLIMEVPDFGIREIDFIRTVVPERFAQGADHSVSGVLQRFLQRRPTSNARFLTEKAVIGLIPEHLFARVVWPIHDNSNR